MLSSSRNPYPHLPVCMRINSEMCAARDDPEEIRGETFDLHGIFGADDFVELAVLAVDAGEGVLVDGFVDHGGESGVAGG